ncbi:MAG: ATP-dependent metallopeptidase FtsH/Yme1/Tma family protein, partial [Edaphobacter sp.]
MNSTVKQILIWVFMITCLIFLWQFVVKNTGPGQEKSISLTQLLNDADAGKVSDVTVNGAEVTGHYRDDKNQFHTIIPANYPDMYKTLRDLGVNITVKDTSGSTWLSLLINLAPFALLLGLWFFMIRQMQSGGNKAMSFGKSKARLLSMQQKKITFKDVAGVDEAKEE